MKVVFAAILSVYVLFGSIGAPLYKHICFAKEEINYSFQSEDNCCSNSEKSNEAIVSAVDCCEFTSTYLQVDYCAFAVTKDLVKNAPVEFSYFPFEIPAISLINIPGSPERGSPVFYGRTLLAFVQSFLI